MSTRNKSVKIRLTPAEKEQLLARCGEATLADYLRNLGLGQPESKPISGRKTTVDPLLLRQLAGIGNNINQIARAINTHSETRNLTELLTVFVAIESQLEEIKTQWS